MSFIKFDNKASTSCQRKIQAKWKFTRGCYNRDYKDQERFIRDIIANGDSVELKNLIRARESVALDPIVKDIIDFVLSEVSANLSDD